MKLLTIRAGGFSATVDGCARGEKDIWFLSMLGNQQAVRAIWARLVKGEAGFVSGDDVGSEPLHLAREAWGTWKFTGMRLPSGAAYHGMLIPELAAYATDRPDFLLLVREQDDPSQLHYRILARRLNLPLHPSWSIWLWHRGIGNGEVEELDATGLRAYLCRPATSALREDIGDAIRRHELGVDSPAAGSSRKAA